jgi:hypothetical protein
VSLLVLTESTLVFEESDTAILTVSTFEILVESDLARELDVTELQLTIVIAAISESMIFFILFLFKNWLVFLMGNDPTPLP